MNVEQARQKGYTFTGIAERNKEDAKVKAKAERKKGVFAVTITEPPSPYSRGGGRFIYSVYSKAKGSTLDLKERSFGNQALGNCRMGKKNDENNS